MATKTLRTTALVTVIAAFGALTVVALQTSGYWGILKPHFESWGGAQVFTDLVILAVLSCIWMVLDARRAGRAAWPFVALTLVAGSFGPLVYLLLRELDGARQPGSETMRA